MVAAFPVFKLGALLLKQLSKPIAAFCKEQAKSQPVFRKYVCMPPAQFYNWCEVKIKMWILNLGKPVSVPVLNEASAIELGANLLGEGILFIIAAAIVVSEYNRSARKEEKKERLIHEEKARLNEMLQDLYFAQQKQATQINNLTRLLYDIDSGATHKPSEPKNGSKPDGTQPHDGSKPADGPRDPTDLSRIPLCKPPTVFIDEDVDETSNSNNNSVESSVILKAVSAVENEFWRPSCTADRETSLLTIAINHIYKDVYRLPMRM